MLAARNEQTMDDDLDFYRVGFIITWLITFVISWIYCVVEYGYLLGVGLGWLPSLIVATILGALWPLVLLVLMIIVFLILKSL